MAEWSEIWLWTWVVGDPVPEWLDQQDDMILLEVWGGSFLLQSAEEDPQCYDVSRGEVVEWDGVGTWRIGGIEWCRT